MKCTQTEVVWVFGSFNCDDLGSYLTKTHQFTIFIHKTNKKNIFLWSFGLLESILIYCICAQYLVGAPFALITASIRRGMKVISLWHCWGGMEAQVSLTVAFSSSAFFGLWFLIFLLTIDSLWGSGLVSLLASQAHQHHGHLTSFWYFWQCGQVTNPAGKSLKSWSAEGSMKCSKISW